jgi:hypothetical protein
VFAVERDLDAVRDALHDANVNFGVCGALGGVPPRFFLVAHEHDRVLIHRVFEACGFLREAATRLRFSKANALAFEISLTTGSLETVWGDRLHRIQRGREIEPCNCVEEACPVTLEMLDSPDVDYSDDAISMRLREVSELRKLCFSLATKPLHNPDP